MARWQAGGAPRSPRGVAPRSPAGATGARFFRAVPAEPAQLAVVRRDLRTWLVSVGAADALADDVLIGVGEALANAVEHAYPDDQGVVEVQVVAESAAALVLAVTVRDRGTWRAAAETAADRDRGGGTAMMRAVGSDVRYDRGAEGTTVRFRVGVPPGHPGAGAVSPA